MNEEYEIIFISDEGRAILNKKTKKVYYSEFEIIEEKNNKIDELQSNWNSLREWLISYRTNMENPDFYEEGIIDCLDETLNKMNELEGKVKECF